MHCPFPSSSYQKCLVGLRSGLWDGHLSSITLATSNLDKPCENVIDLYMDHDFLLLWGIFADNWGESHSSCIKKVKGFGSDFEFPSIQGLVVEVVHTIVMFLSHICVFGDGLITMLTSVLSLSLSLSLPSVSRCLPKTQTAGAFIRTSSELSQRLHR